MGRADVLLRFLQFISKDKPQDIEPYLTGLDDDTEHRPIVDQIVDKIIAGDENLYEKYAQARREIGSRNPYASVEDLADQSKKSQALGFFISKWIDLENTLQRLADNKVAFRLPLPLLLQRLKLPKDTRQQIDFIRYFRNKTVHGIELPAEEQLIEVGNLIEKLIEELSTKTTEFAENFVKGAKKRPREKQPR